MFVQESAIMSVIDGMAYDKMNVLHWHLGDAQRFPVCVDSQKALCHAHTAKDTALSSAVFEKANVSRIVEFARMRGVRFVHTMQ